MARALAGKKSKTTKMAKRSAAQRAALREVEARHAARARAVPSEELSGSHGASEEACDPLQVFERASLLPALRGLTRPARAHTGELGLGSGYRRRGW